MKITKRLYWTDLNYFNTENNTMVGDLLDFAEEEDRRTENLNEAKESILLDAQNYFSAEPGNDTIPIRTLYSSKFTDEIEEGDEFCTWYAEEKEGTRTTVGIYVYASEDQARKAGLLEHLKGTPVFIEPEK